MATTADTPMLMMESTPTRRSQVSWFRQISVITVSKVIAEKLGLVDFFVKKADRSEIYENMSLPDRRRWAIMAALARLASGEIRLLEQHMPRNAEAVSNAQATEGEEIFFRLFSGRETDRVPLMLH